MPTPTHNQAPLAPLFPNEADATGLVIRDGMLTTPGAEMPDDQFATLNKNLVTLTGVGITRLRMDGLSEEAAVTGSAYVLDRMKDVVTAFHSDDHSQAQRTAIFASPTTSQKTANEYFIGSVVRERPTPAQQLAISRLYLPMQRTVIQAAATVHEVRQRAAQGKATEQDELQHKQALQVYEAVGIQIPEELKKLPTSAEQVQLVIRTTEERQHSAVLRTGATAAAALTLAVGMAQSAAANEASTSPNAVAQTQPSSHNVVLDAIPGAPEVFAGKKTKAPDQSVAAAIPGTQPVVEIPAVDVNKPTALTEIPAASATEPAVLTEIPPSVIPNESQIQPDEAVVQVPAQENQTPGVQTLPHTPDLASPSVQTLPHTPDLASPGVQTLPHTPDLEVTTSITMPAAEPTAVTPPATIPRAAFTPQFGTVYDSIRAAAEQGDPTIALSGLSPEQKDDPSVRNMVAITAAALEALTTGGEDAEDVLYLLEDARNNPVTVALADQAELTTEPDQVPKEVAQSIAHVLAGLATSVAPQQEVSATPETPATPDQTEPGSVIPNEPTTPESPVVPPEAEPAPSAPEAPAEPSTPTPPVPGSEVPAEPELPAEPAPQEEQPAQSTVEGLTKTYEDTMKRMDKALETGDLRDFYPEDQAKDHKDKIPINDELEDQMKAHRKHLLAIISGDKAAIAKVFEYNEEEIKRIMAGEEIALTPEQREKIKDMVFTDGEDVWTDEQKLAFVEVMVDLGELVGEATPAEVDEPAEAEPLPIPETPPAEEAPEQEAPAEDGGEEANRQDLYSELAGLGEFYYEGEGSSRKADWKDIAPLIKYLEENDDIGINLDQAIGVAANCIAESSCDPSEHQDDGPAKGSLQWEGVRFEALKEFAKKKGVDWDTWAAQKPYIIHEFLTTEKNALSKLQGADSEEEAAYLFAKYFERPGTPHYELRKGIANKLDKIIRKYMRKSEGSSRGGGERDGSSEEDKVSYARPIAAKHEITCGLDGYRSQSGFHTGVDYGAPIGTRVNAPADGKIIETGSDSAAGKYMIIEHADGRRSIFQHLSKFSGEVGEKVSAGEKVAEVGNTGLNTTGSHLHWTLTKPGVTKFPSKNDSDIKDLVEDPQKFYN